MRDEPGIESKHIATAAAGVQTDAGPLRWRAFVALIILPAVCVALLITRHGVNIPYYDQWVGMAPLFQSMEAGVLRPGDFTAQHNEHRVLIPRLIFFAAGLLTKWDTRVEMFLTLAVLVGVAAILWKLLGATGCRESRRTCVLFFFIGLVVLTPLQQQNLVNGFQLIFVIPLLFVVSGFLAAISLRHPWNYVVSALLATASTFSMAGGLLSWFLILPVLVWCGDRRAGRGRWIAFWAAAFLLNVGAYFFHFRPPPISAGDLSRQPITGLLYLLAYIGAPFTWGTFPLAKTAVVIGGGLIAMAAAAAGAIWRWRKEASFFQRGFPWLMVVATGLAYGAMTAAGRFHLGPAKALETRYVTYAVMVPIGLLVLGALICERLATKRPAACRWMAPALLALGAVLFVFHGLAVFQQRATWAIEKRDRLFIKAAVQTIGIIDEPEVRRYLSPTPGPLLDTVQALARLGYLHPLPLTSPSIAAIGDAAAKGEARYGMLDQSGQERDRMAVMGWAILPDRLQPADAVLITYDDDQGVPTIFAITEVADPRPDVAGKVGEPDLATCGWRCMFAPGLLPAGATVIKAWAYDAEQGRAWRLAGSAVARR